MLFLDESINVYNAKYLLSLPSSELKKLIWIDDKKLDNGEIMPWSPDTYIKRLNDWLKKMIYYDGTNSVKYDYSKKLIKYGRRYAVGFGVQTLQRQLRGFLTGDLYNDYDISNCHPNILLYLVKKYYPDKQFINLESYVKNRDSILNKYKIDKQQILICMNSKDKNNTNSIFLSKLDAEFKEIQNLFFDKTPTEWSHYEIFKHNNPRNQKGGFLNTILTIYENNIIDKVINNFDKKDISTIMFDGLHIKKSLDINETIKKLNDITKEYNLIWTHKPADTSIKIDDSVVIDEDNFNKDYDTVKEIFEKEHLMITNPISFIWETELEGIKKIYTYTKNNFKDLVAPFVFEKFVKGSVKLVPFFDEWIKDKKRRKYHHMDFIPKDKVQPYIYNTFTGFEYNKIIEDYELVDIKPFIDLISKLVDNEKESIEYVLNYLAHIIQKPYEKSEVILLFKSKQGYGKDTLINFMEKIMGKSNNYIGRTAEVNDIFGNFNSIMKNNLILQINELQGKDGFATKEKIKNLSTADTITINRKYLEGYEQTNYCRIFIFSNNLTPVEIPSDDRRYVVFTAQEDKPEREFFNNLYKCLKDERFIYSLYYFLKTRNIKKVSLRDDRPITKAYDKLKKQCIHPFYEYLDSFMDLGHRNRILGLRKNKNNPDNVRITPTLLYEDFKKFMESRDDNLKISFNNIKAMLADLDVEQIRTQTNNERKYYYNIWINVLREKLRKMGVYSDVCVDDWDDFE